MLPSPDDNGGSFLPFSRVVPNSAPEPNGRTNATKREKLDACESIRRRTGRGALPRRGVKKRTRAASPVAGSRRVAFCDR